MKRNFWLLISIFLLAFILRLYKISQPLADWHAFRQVDTASVTREYVKHGINLLEPKYHDLGNIQSGLDNLDGYRMVEFPFVNAMIAFVLINIPQLDLVTTSRFASVLFSMGTLLSLYFLVKKLSDNKTALLTSFIYAVLPYSVFYSRAVLPESPMLFFSTFSLLTFHLFIENFKNKNKQYLAWLLTSAISLALALLLKPFVIFLAPIYISLSLYLFNSKNKKSLKLWISVSLQLCIYLAISFVPLILWRQHITNYPSGIPASDWLLNGECQFDGSIKSIVGSAETCLRFKPAWFRWLFWERLTKLITGFGTLIFPLAFLNWKKKDTIVYASWWLGILLYFSVIATGNVRHDYYQVITIPIIAITFAKALIQLYNYANKLLNKKIALAISTILLLTTTYFSYTQVHGYFNINHWEYVAAGKKADEILPENAKIIAPAFGDTMFLFQTNRTGWPIGFEIEDKIKLGAEYYVNTSFDDETNELIEKYKVLEKTGDYVIIDLSVPNIDL